MSSVLAMFVPVPNQVLDDARIGAGGGYLAAWVARGITRRMTALLFDEDWSDARAEQERLEFGRLIPWDAHVDDEEDCW